MFTKKIVCLRCHEITKPCIISYFYGYNGRRFKRTVDLCRRCFTVLNDLHGIDSIKQACLVIQNKRYSVFDKLIKMPGKV